VLQRVLCITVQDAVTSGGAAHQFARAGERRRQFRQLLDLQIDAEVHASGRCADHQSQQSGWLIRIRAQRHEAISVATPR
jgi:hypothetical protein